MTERANQTTGLTNDRAANWAPEVEFSPFRKLSHRQNNDVPVLLLNQPNRVLRVKRCSNAQVPDHSTYLVIFLEPSCMLFHNLL